MRHIVAIALAGFLMLAGCADTSETTDAPTDPTDSPADTEAPADTAPPDAAGPTAAGCATFDDLALGTVYVLGDNFNTDGIDVEVLEFFVGGAPFDNFTEVENGGMAGGSGNEMEINNVSLLFKLPPGPDGWSVQFGEYGGEVNLAINGDNFGADTPDFQDWNGLVFGGAEVQAAGGLGTPGGKLELIGPGIEELAIGGQELWIDNVCPLEN